MRQLHTGRGNQTSQSEVHRKQLGSIRPRSSTGQLSFVLTAKGRTQTMAIKRMLGSWILNANEIKRMATGLKAWTSARSMDPFVEADLEHLDKADTETEVGIVGQNQ